MGLFVYLRGDFECVRCRRPSDAWIQTKLLRHEADNSSRSYRIRDSEVLVGLDEYCPLHPWHGRSPLVVAVGEWADPSHVIGASVKCFPKTRESRDAWLPTAGMPSV